MITWPLLGAPCGALGGATGLRALLTRIKEFMRMGLGPPLGYKLKLVAQ